MEKSRSELNLPGFRFHPTEEELLNFYLKGIVSGKKSRSADIIGFLNIYNHHPTELPRLAEIGEREWYFFVPRDRKQGSGGRPNRTTKTGFWKATGSDRQIYTTSDPRTVLGVKKTMVFYQGRAPRGTKTDWIMNEYRLPEKCSQPKEIVLCKVYRKATSLKALEHRAMMEEEIEKYTSPLPLTPSMDSVSFCSQVEERNDVGLKKDDEEERVVLKENYSEGCSSLVLPNGMQSLAELQVPKFTTDWTQDSFWTQFSPWLDNFTPFLPLC